jgi:ABC-2 type transport system permease protein
MLLPLLLTVIIFIGVGKLINKQTNNLKQPQEIMVVDQDFSPTSIELRQTLEKSNFKIDLSNLSTQAALQAAKTRNESLVVLIPRGFGDSYLDPTLPPVKIVTYSLIKSFSVIGNLNHTMFDGVIAALNSSKHPILTTDNVMVGNLEANVSFDQVMNFISGETLFIPVILFVIIILASQMIATSIASEKENKTLETLLSTPVKRQDIVTAKLLAAGIVAGLFALVYIFGFKYYMNNTGTMTGISPTLISGVSSTTSSGLSQSTHQAIIQLGLVFDAKSYILLGFSLFFGILAALAVALILGAFAEDVKSVQSVITPLMILVMIPYFLVMFMDFSSLPSSIRDLIYLIPFAHPFLAIQFLLAHQYLPVIYGIVYEAIIFVLFVYLASKIFASDNILTLRLGRKNR